jgi:hypothetical protein
MNYVRRFTALLLAIIFCAALIIGLGVILAVKNVNVEYIDYSGNFISEYESVAKNFDDIKGSNLLFLSEDDVNKQLISSQYIKVLSFEKVFPCTVNITLKERVEAYAINSQGEYDMYDTDGVYVRTAKNNINNLDAQSDASPNILVSCSQEGILNVAEAGNYFKNNFGGLRKYISTITIEDDDFQNIHTMTFSLHSGVKIVLIDYSVNVMQKMQCVYEIYEGLTENQKCSGAIRAYDRVASSIAVSAIYTA